MKLSELSLSDLEMLESRLWDKYHEAYAKSLQGDKDQIPIRDTIEAKLAEIKFEINNRIEQLLNNH